MAVVGLFFWQSACSRSLRHDLSEELVATYSVQWGLGMTEAISIKRRATWWNESDVVSQEIVERPYWSGALLYQGVDGSGFMVKLGSNWGGGLYRFHKASMRFEHLQICNFQHAHLQQGAGTNGASRHLSGHVFVGRFKIVGPGRGTHIVYEAAAELREEPPLINGECP